MLAEGLTPNMSHVEFGAALLVNPLLMEACLVSDRLSCGVSVNLSSHKDHID